MQPARDHWAPAVLFGITVRISVAPGKQTPRQETETQNKRMVPAPEHFQS